jgi:very-short-patch-repair endonuclease
LTACTPLAIRRERKMCPQCKKHKMILVRGVYCSTHCSNKAKWSNPAFIAKQQATRSTPQFRKADTARLRALHTPATRAASSQRMRKTNPMWIPGVKARAASSRRARGDWRPPIQGGNGKALPLAERVLWADPWQSQHVVRTYRKQPWPKHYKIDLAYPEKMIVIEADGNSHQALVRRAQDRRRDDCLKALGWRVLRFRNMQILNDLASVLQTIKASYVSITSK